MAIVLTRGMVAAIMVLTIGILSVDNSIDRDMRLKVD